MRTNFLLIISKDLFPSHQNFAIYCDPKENLLQDIFV
jgi:hypothetical protein